MLRYFMLGGAQLAVGAAAIFARDALAGASPIAVAAARLVIAAAILLVVALFMRTRNTTAINSNERIVILCAGIALAIHFATWIASLNYVSIAVSVLLVTTTPLFTATYDAIVLRRPLSRLSMLAFPLGMLGVWLVVRGQNARPPQPGHEMLGATLALIGAVAIGAYFLLARTIREKLGTQRLVTATYSWAAVALCIAALAVHQAPPPLANTQAWMGILGMALVAQLIGHTLLNASLRWFSPSIIAFATLLEPLIAGALALIICGERLGYSALGGGALVLIAVAIVLREDWTAPNPQME